MRTNTVNGITIRGDKTMKKVKLLLLGLAMTMILGGCGDSDGDVTVEQVVTPDAAEPVVIPDTAEQTDAVTIVEFVWAATELSPEKLCLEVSGNTVDNQLVYAENTSTETEILDGNGEVAVKLINDYGISENTITAVIYDTGRYSLQFGDAEGFMQGIPNLPDDLKITVTLPDGTSTQLNKPDYMMRGDTGYWYYDIEIENGKLD